jgi:long-chain acyl-CoA synthetase
MLPSFFIERFKSNKEKTAIIWRDQEYTYNWLLNSFEKAKTFLIENKINTSDIVALHADFTPSAIAFFLALIDNGNIIVPVSFSVKDPEDYYSIAEVGSIIEIRDDKQILKKLPQDVSHKILIELKQRKHPGLILFSSGTTGESKASVNDFRSLLNKYKIKHKPLVTISFLLFDHIGGINTLFYILSNAGTLIALEDRSPENVCKLIEKYNVELLPTSPTFINLILMSRSCEKHDISCLKLVTYGTEMMSETTLKLFAKFFPKIEMKQTYGLSELGILRSKSKSSDSLWLKIGGEDYNTKIVDNILFIKSKTAMLGYLNAPSPYDKEGWFNTQDRVEVNGKWIRFLGRDSDIINVGGEKVYPAEVENIIQEVENVAEVSVFGEKNIIIGEIVCAKVRLIDNEESKVFKKRLKKYCNKRLERYKVPVKIEITDKKLYSIRFKKTRWNLKVFI